MGATASLTTVPEDIDHETFKLICGDRYELALFETLKNDRGFVSKAAFEREITTKTHVFLTHDWGTDELGRNNHERVTVVNEWLKDHGVVTWFDSDRMKGNVVQQMFNGIDNTCIVIVFITKNYIDKISGKNGQGDNCLKEFNYGESTTSLVFSLACFDPHANPPCLTS